MANCNPITISNCPPANTCDACKEIISSNCVKYTGVNIPCAGITTNTILTNVIVDLASSICELSAATNSTCNIPQASIKLHRNGSSLGQPRYNFFSSSAPVYVGCVKSYTIFDTDDVEIYSGTLQQCTGFVLAPGNVTPLTPYYIVEYINCGDCGSTESLNQCFQTNALEIGIIIQPSCDCCPDYK